MAKSDFWRLLQAQTKEKDSEDLIPVMGRPKIEINKKDLESLAELHCTSEEISGFFDCSVDTIERRVKEFYGLTFAEFIKQKSGKRKAALRRMQFQAAEKGNTAMLIWLGKNWLDQVDKKEVRGVEDKPITLNYKLDDE